MVETIRELAQKRKTNNKEKYMTMSKNLRQRKCTDLVLKYQRKTNEPSGIKDKALIFQDCVSSGEFFYRLTLQLIDSQILIRMSFEKTLPTCPTTIHNWQISKTISCIKRRKKNKKILFFHNSLLK